MKTKPQKRQRASLSVLVDQDDLDVLKEIAGRLACDDDRKTELLGKRMLKQVHTAAKKLGFRYAHP